MPPKEEQHRLAVQGGEVRQEPDDELGRPRPAGVRSREQLLQADAQGDDRAQAAQRLRAQARVRHAAQDAPQRSDGGPGPGGRGLRSSRARCRPSRTTGPPRSRRSTRSRRRCPCSGGRPSMAKPRSRSRDQRQCSDVVARAARRRRPRRRARRGGPRVDRTAAAAGTRPGKDRPGGTGAHARFGGAARVFAHPRARCAAQAAAAAPPDRRRLPPLSPLAPSPPRRSPRSRRAAPQSRP